MIERVGVIGAGVMGMGIAASALRGGFQVTIRDTDPAREDLARAGGLRVAASPAELAGLCEAIAIVVVDAAQIDAVYRGPSGLLAALALMPSLDEQIPDPQALPGLPMPTKSPAP